MAVCGPCRGIIPGILTDAHRRYTLFQELREMIKSAEQCPSCAIIVDAIRLNQNDDVYPNQCITFEELKYQPASYHPADRKVILDGLGDNDFPGSLNNPKSHIYGLSITITRELDASPMGYLGIYAEDVLAGSSVVTGRFPSQDTGSNEALSLVREWMHVCTGTHQHCRVTLAGDVLNERSEPPKLPTRVVDLGQGQQHLCPRLVESHGACAQYAALSHCWGPPVKRPLMTTAGNVHDHLRGIPFDRLPKTFQDAFIVARSLGLRYVWIDSLCILQGDSEDWLRESAGMGLIYQNASITIAASGAADGTVGCFFKRTSPPKTVRLPESTLIKDSIGIVHLALPDSRHNGTFDRYYADQYGNLPDLSPLKRRAWITQEWQLARRIVHYRQGMMVWCCNTTAEREDGRNFNGLVHEKTLSKYPRSQSSNLQQSNGELDIGAHFTRLTFWNSLVSSYTARSLTYQEDRLVALEGLVTELKRRWPDQQYSFGLWHEWLHIQVLWRGPEEQSICLERPESLQRIGIPTWSWASTVGPVHFTRFGPPLRDFGMLEPIWSQVSVIGKTILVTAKVKRVGRIQPPSQKNDVQLRQLGRPAWRLGFTGNGEYAAGIPKTGTLLGPEQTEYLVLDPDDEERPLGLASLDEGVIPEEEVFCVPVAKRGPTVGEDAFSHQRLALFLVVDQGDRANLTYLRVGMGTIMKQGWFDDVQKEQIRIN